MRLVRRLGLMTLPLCLGGVCLAASLTPSLIPRGWLTQGILSGVVMAIGYLIGRAGVALWRGLGLPEPSGRAARIGRLAAGLPVAVLLAVCLGFARHWQNGIRVRMGMGPAEGGHTPQMIVVALVVFLLLLALGHAVQWLFDLARRKLYRVMPPRAANVAGLVLTGLALVVVTRDGVLDHVIAALDRSYTVAQNLFADAPPRPAIIRTGGDGSLIDWEALGQPGRDFVTGGPHAAAIAAFRGAPARDPIRVYVGLAQAETAEDRARLAVDELIRQGGFDREVLVVALPTGTGWLDPGSFDVLEYMHGGDVASVAVQYSYLQSPLALILETEAGLDQARELIRAVRAHWTTLPRDSRPRLYIHGLSLGAWASMYATDLFALLDDPIDGALWVGPPFPSAFWREAVAARNPDSRYVEPKVKSRRLIRFATRLDHGGGPEGWGTIRLMFLQYPSDPIVFYDPRSLWRAPAWMREPPAADVSPDLRFIPIVTQFQLALDMALATSAPAGFGHSYWAPDYIGPWRAVTAPAGWSEADSARLRTRCDNGFQRGCDNG
ncbi:hypothetical protein B0A89_08985 [Paracoccus contaminans]|uniref:Alpha/beta-hydrolase catalytic domain-containing protein n=2 Tax=Paracoccus contaminans TaxID=1945662 RepID=A0A1W6CY07_9RHOB|nr:hypothetical protein B0A89_08985 [Paracoccus contaminans]